MQAAERVELALEHAVAAAAAPGAPPLLAAALRYAVFPGGHRIRPQIVLAVAAACGDGDPKAADAAAAAIELLHCASLAHDDLPASTTPTCVAASRRCMWRSASRSPC